MTKRQTRQYEMLVRVRAFGKTHQDHFAEGGEGSVAFNAVGAALTEVDAFNGGKQTARRQSRQAKRSARSMLVAQLRSVAHSARVMAKTVPDADEKFPLPTGQSDVALLQAGLLFVKEVGPMKDAFMRCGLPATFAEDLQQAVTGFRQAIAGRQAGKTGSAVSHVAIRAALKQGVDAVDSLDVLVRNALGSDIKAIAAWKRDRHVDLAGGKSASAGAAPNQPAPMPASPAEPPVPPPAGEPEPTSSAALLPTNHAGDQPLRRAS